MKYEFEGTVEFRENENSIAVPFNVWEVCEKIGDAPVRVCFDDVCFTCDLLPKGQGYYDIPVDESTLSKVELGKKYLISIEIVGNAVEVSENSPYSVEHPIRKIDGVELVTQPWDGLRYYEMQRVAGEYGQNDRYFGISWHQACREDRIYARKRCHASALLYYYGENGKIQSLSCRL